MWHNYRISVSDSFVVQAGDEDTAMEKALDIISWHNISDMTIEDVQREDEDPYED